MALTTTEVFGFSQSVIEFIRNSKTDLEGMGITVDTWITDLEMKKSEAVRLNDEQEKHKASLKKLTGQTESALSDLYDTTSSRLDALIGSLGKKTEVAKQAATLRSRIRKGKNSAKV